MGGRPLRLSISEGEMLCFSLSSDQCHIIKEACDFMGPNLSMQLTSLVAIDIVVVELCFWWFKSKLPHARLNLALLFITTAHGMSCFHTQNFRMYTMLL